MNQFALNGLQSHRVLQAVSIGNDWKLGEEEGLKSCRGKLGDVRRKACGSSHVMLPLWMLGLWAGCLLSAEAGQAKFGIFFFLSLHFFRTTKINRQ